MSDCNTSPSTAPIGMVGVPFDAFSSYLRGAREAPDAIRAALNSESSNRSTERGLDLTDNILVDLGNLSIPPDEAGYLGIEDQLAALIEGGRRVVALGGDHSVTYPIIKAHAARYSHLNILHFDAHPDLYDNFEGNRYSHACPFARVMEAGLVDRLVQVGIRTATAHLSAQASRFGVETIEMSQWNSAKSLAFEGPLYISLDLDVLDPAFATGISHWEPGGLTTRELIGLVQSVRGTVVGADIVELNPRRDPDGQTAMVAAKLLKEIADRMING